MTLPAVILAGGLSSRMGGGDKVLLDLHGQPLLAHVIARLAPQVGPLAINANGDPARFARFGLQCWLSPCQTSPVRWRVCWRRWIGRRGLVRHRC